MLASDCFYEGLMFKILKGCQRSQRSRLRTRLRPQLCSQGCASPVADPLASPLRLQRTHPRFMSGAVPAPRACARPQTLPVPRDCAQPRIRRPERQSGTSGVRSLSQTVKTGRGPLWSSIASGDRHSSGDRSFYAVMLGVGLWGPSGFSFVFASRVGVEEFEVCLCLALHGFEDLRARERGWEEGEEGVAR